MKRLVLIDRDGTINVEQNYLSAPEQIELFPETASSIKLLRGLGLTVAVITNQSAVGRGYFNIERLEEIHNRLRQLLSDAETQVDAIYFCPHTPEDNCKCRKPETYLAECAAADFNADLSKSFVIGDNVCDIELGKNIGAATILVRSGYGRQTEREQKTKPDYTVENIFEAACLIKEIIEGDETTNEKSGK